MLIFVTEKEKDMNRKFHYTKETYYLRNDRTISTIVIESSGEVVYEVYQDGYYSYCHGLGNLFSFLDGNTNARLICLEDPKQFEGICELMSPKEE